nr:hypothetical protein [Tanacetum cinerariifolium]
MEVEPDIENMTLEEYLKYDSKKEESKDDLVEIIVVNEEGDCNPTTNIKERSCIMKANFQFEPFIRHVATAQGKGYIVASLLKKSLPMSLNYNVAATMQLRHTSLL